MNISILELPEKGKTADGEVHITVSHKGLHTTTTIVFDGASIDDILREATGIAKVHYENTKNGIF